MSLVRVHLPAMAAAVAIVVTTAGSRADDSPFARAKPRFTQTGLQRLLGAIAAPQLPARQRAARRLLQASPADAPLLHRRLHRRTDVAATDYRNLLRAIGAHVPNRHGRFGPAPAKKVDWLDALLKRPSDGTGPLSKALAEARRSVALMRALAATRHPEAAVSLLRFAYRHEGAFRDECGRLIRLMGDHAVPALVRSGSLRDPLAFKMRRYAAYQLDRMNRARPELALRTADPALQVELLHAYGEVRATSAVNAVLAKTNAPAAAVRHAARWALLRYVSGRPPKAIRRHLRLPGGKKSDVERSLYLTYRQLARQSIAARLAKELASSSQQQSQLRAQLSKEEDARALAARLFAHFDSQRFAAQQRRYREAQRLARAGKAPQAMAAFDRLLQQDPDHPQAHLMADVFERAGLDALDGGRYQRATFLLTKAVVLLRQKPEGGNERQIARVRAERAVAEALRDREAGLGADWRLEEARALAPKMPLLRRAARSIVASRRATILVAGGVGLLLLLLGTAGWVLRRRRGGRPT